MCACLSALADKNARPAKGLARGEACLVGQIIADKNWSRTIERGCLHKGAHRAPLVAAARHELDHTFTALRGPTVFCSKVIGKGDRPRLHRRIAPVMKRAAMGLVLVINAILGREAS